LSFSERWKGTSQMLNHAMIETRFSSGNLDQAGMGH